MVGYGEVGITHRFGAPGHLDDRRLAVTPGRMGMDVTLVLGEIQDRLVVSSRLLHLLAQAVEISAAAGLEYLCEHLGDAGAHSLESGQLVGAVQRLALGPLNPPRPRRRRKRFGAELLLRVLA